MASADESRRGFSWLVFSRKFGNTPSHFSLGCRLGERQSWIRPHGHGGPSLCLATGGESYRHHLGLVFQRRRLGAIYAANARINGQRLGDHLIHIVVTISGQPADKMDSYGLIIQFLIIAVKLRLL